MSDQPIIIKKKKGGDHGHHGGAWKVAYADFVTAMMALFIVLWVLGQDQATKDAIAGYFKDPVGFNSGGSGGNGVMPAPGSGKNNNPEVPPNAEELEKKMLEQMGEKIKEQLASNTEFASLAEHIMVEFTKDGLRIEVLENADDIFFNVGTADLKPQARALLVQIGNEIAKLPNKIIVEGHTDARPFPGQNGYTNFELSADRANSARNALSQSKIVPEQIDEIRGYADRRLRDKKDPFNLVNRRISIIVKYGSKNE